MPDVLGGLFPLWELVLTTGDTSSRSFKEIERPQNFLNEAMLTQLGLRVRLAAGLTRRSPTEEDWAYAVSYWRSTRVILS